MTSPSSTPLVKVKPLVWEPSVKEGGYYAGQDWHAHHRGYHAFWIQRVSRDSGWMLCQWGVELRSLHPTLEAAQAAAQEQWNAFVRSAIES